MTKLFIDEDALDHFHQSAIPQKLNDLYRQVPSGSCEGSARCCSESVNMFYSEFINVVETLRQHATLEYYTVKALQYYLTELVIIGKCPLLQEDNLCSCYEARPLPCRIFGHLNRTEYEENYQAVLAENRAAADELRGEYGIDVPQALTEQKIPFCLSFKSDSSFTAEQRDDLVDRLFGIESTFLVKELLDAEDFGLSLVQWFAYTLLGREQAQKLRIAVSKEISATGSSEPLTIVMNELTS